MTYEIKRQIDLLSPDEQMDIGSYATVQWKKAKDLVDYLALQESIPTPSTDHDADYIAKYLHNPMIQRSKIRFSNDAIFLDDLAFPRSISSYTDVHNVPWLSLDKNVYHHNWNDYFDFDAIQYIQNAWYAVLSKEQWEQAVSVFWWDYRLLSDILNYPQVGFRQADTIWSAENNATVLWSSSSDDSLAYVTFLSENVSAGPAWDAKSAACSLILLQN
jgi:hypothetical protein